MSIHIHHHKKQNTISILYHDHRRCVHIVRHVVCLAVYLVCLFLLLSTCCRSLILGAHERHTPRFSLMHGRGHPVHQPRSVCCVCLLVFCICWCCCCLSVLLLLSALLVDVVYTVDVVGCGLMVLAAVSNCCGHVKRKKKPEYQPWT